MTKTYNEKLTEAIAYLRSRNKSLMDGCKWVPTTAVSTDVKKTIEKYKKGAVK